MAERGKNLAKLLGDLRVRVFQYQKENTSKIGGSKIQFSCAEIHAKEPGYVRWLCLESWTQINGALSLAAARLHKIVL
jgi:hypothetical protein